MAVFNGHFYSVREWPQRFLLGSFPEGGGRRREGIEGWGVDWILHLNRFPKIFWRIPAQNPDAIFRFDWEVSDGESSTNRQRILKESSENPQRRAKGQEYVQGSTKNPSKRHNEREKERKREREREKASIKAAISDSIIKKRKQSTQLKPPPPPSLLPATALFHSSLSISTRLKWPVTLNEGNYPTKMENGRADANYREEPHANNRDDNKRPREAGGEETAEKQKQTAEKQKQQKKKVTHKRPEKKRKKYSNTTVLVSIDGIDVSFSIESFHPLLLLLLQFHWDDFSTGKEKGGRGKGNQGGGGGGGEALTSSSWRVAECKYPRPLPGLFSLSSLIGGRSWSSCYETLGTTAASIFTNRSPIPHLHLPWKKIANVSSCFQSHEHPKESRMKRRRKRIPLPLTPLPHPNQTKTKQNPTRIEQETVDSAAGRTTNFPLDPRNKRNKRVNIRVDK